MTYGMQPADVCIICALEEEANAVEQVIAEHCKVAFLTNTTDDGRFVYRTTTIPNSKQEPLSLVLLCQTRPGPVSAAFDVGTLLQVFQPCFVGMSGICAGDKRHTHLGDLVVAEYAYHFEEGKVTRDEIGSLIHHPEGITYGPTSQVLQYVRTFGAWETPITALKKQMLGTSEKPQCVMTLMASGMAVRSDDPFPVLRQQHRKTWALDMEAASFYLALQATPDLNGLVIKGVVDYADLCKDNAFHDFAARASALYLLTFIQEYVTTNVLLCRRNPPVFTVPYPRNSVFTGRDELLREIHSRFQAGQATAISQPQGICGLGGIGKTQIAMEYAYRYRHEYQYVLWTLSDTRESLVSGYVALAGLLRLLERVEQDQTQIVQAVREWLQTHGDWLLILDNADDLAMVYDFLPPRLGGHLLLTTRAQATGPRISSLEVDTMEEDTGALFLLRRAKLLAPTAQLTEAPAIDVITAREICQELGGLPLALDQAGAYIEETQCGLSGYQSLYQAQRAEMLSERGSFAPDYPKSVATTWSLSFKRVEEQNAAAADLLRMSAYLSPDTIPEELFRQGAALLGPVLEPVVINQRLLNQAVKTLLSYSLIRRDPKHKTLSVHRLVQAVLKDGMDETLAQQWMERVIQVIDAVSPEVEPSVWGQYEQLVSHALVCANHPVHREQSALEQASLLLKTGRYLLERVQQREAEALFLRALQIREQVLSPSHPDVARSLNGLAQLYRYQGQLGKAEPLYQRALHIFRQAFVSHPDVATTLNNLATLYTQQGKYTDADVLYQQALRILEQAWGPEHPDVARTLNNLAMLHHVQGQLEKAEPLYQRALRIWKQAPFPGDPSIPVPLNNLAHLYRDQGKFADAEPLYQGVLRIWEQALGLENPGITYALVNLTTLYTQQGMHAEAEPFYQRACYTWEQGHGLEHPAVAYALKELDTGWSSGLAHIIQTVEKYSQLLLLHTDVLSGIGNLSVEQGGYADARILFQRVVTLRERVLGAQHPATAEALHDLAACQQAQGNRDEALSLYQRALAIREQALGSDHPQTLQTRERAVSLLREVQ